MSIFSKVTNAVNGAWDTVRGTVDNVSDAIYGVMPSPIQHVVDAVGQPVANAVNNVANKVDNAVPESVQALIKAGVAPYAAWLLGSTVSAPVTLPAGLGAAAAGAPAAVASAAAAATPAATPAAAAGAGLGSAVASGLGSGIGSTLSGILPAAAGYAGAIDYNQTMRDTNKETNATNMAIANQNLGFQREILDYNKNLQNIMFNREDTSYQRTVNDMRAAGMSPLAMKGTNGAGEAIALGAMNNQYQHTPLSNYKSPLDALASINPIGYLSSLEDLRSKRLQNNLASDTLSYQKARVKAESLLAQYDSSDSKRREKFNSAFGIHNSMSEREKMFCIISKLMGTDILNSDGSPNTKVDYDKVLDSLSNSKSAQIINNIAKDITGSSSAEKIANSRKTDIYGNSPNDMDEKIRQKVKRGEKLNAFESFIYYLMQKGVK